MQNTPLNTSSSRIIEDINDIVKNKPSVKASIDIEIKLHTEVSDLNYEDGVYLDGIFIQKDFANNITDYIEINLKVGLGTYIYDIYDYLHNIELSLIYVDQLSEKIIERYKAVYLKDSNSRIPVILNASKTDLNQQPAVNIKLQLLDRSAEIMRIKTTQGNFDAGLNGKSTIENFFKSIIGDQASKLSIENKPCLDAIDIEKPDNTNPVTSITLPSGTRVIDIPNFYQSKSAGVYNGGIASYIQTFNGRKTFFIYSLYNSKKYENQDYKVIFYSPLDASLIRHDKTYEYKDKVLKVLVEPIVGLEDERETGLMSSGSGMRVSNANSFMKKPVDITEDGPKFNSTSLNTEIVLKDRTDGLNYAPVSSCRSSTNLFNKTSVALKTDGIELELRWYNSNTKFIYPGQACKIIYEGKDNKLIERYGVIQSIVTIIQNESKTEITKYVGKVNLSVFSTLKIFLDR